MQLKLWQLISASQIWWFSRLQCRVTHALDYALDQLEVDADFVKKKSFSATRRIFAWMAMQNFRFWDETNTYELHQVAMHPQKVTV